MKITNWFFVTANYKLQQLQVYVKEKCKSYCNIFQLIKTNIFLTSKGTQTKRSEELCDINKDKFSQHIFYLLLIVFLQDFLYQKRGKILAEVVAVFFCQIFCERCDGFFGEIDGELFVVEKRCKVVEVARHDSDRNHSQDQKYFHFVFWFCSP